MRTKIKWYSVKQLPDGDIYTALLAIEEPNPNYLLYKRMNMPTSITNKSVIGGIFDFNSQHFMAYGKDLTPIVKYWAAPSYPQEKKSWPEKIRSLMGHNSP